MDFGISIFLIAVGAILTFAVSFTTSGVNIHTIGVILMLVGGLGMLWSLIMYGVLTSRGSVRTSWYRPTYRSTTYQSSPAAPPADPYAGGRVVEHREEMR